MTASSGIKFEQTSSSQQYYNNNNKYTTMKKISSQEFYKTYHGHPTNHLKDLLIGLKKLDPAKNCVYLSGDSSLDNKFWLASGDYRPALNGYEHILEPTLMKPDVCYHLNKFLKNSNYYAINCAIEESTISARHESLLAQDKFIHNNIKNDDILIVSVGGNDIALSPSLGTIWNMVLLIYMNSLETIMTDPKNAWGMRYFVKMFKDSVKNYILKLIGVVKPKKIIVCMIYNPDEQMTGSWADRTLGYLGYNENPQKLQEAIKQIFKYATSKIKIAGVEIVPFPMFEVLDGKDTNDYIQRVEPSIQGGEKLAKAFTNVLFS